MADEDGFFASLLATGTIVVESRLAANQSPFARTIIQLDGDVITSIDRAMLGDRGLAEMHRAHVVAEIAKLENDWPFVRVRAWFHGLHLASVVAAIVAAIVGLVLQKKIPDSVKPTVVAFVTSGALAGGAWLARHLAKSALLRWVARFRRNERIDGKH